MAVGWEQIFTLAGKVTVAGILLAVAWAFYVGRLVPRWVFDRERENGDKLMGLLSAADERVMEANEQVRRFKAVAAKAVDELKRCKGEAGGGQ
jgi:hypothetical protein